MPLFFKYVHNWMCVCMSSGIVVKTDLGWKIKHYQLSVAMPNDVVNDFIQLVKNYEERFEINDQ